jgi:hypothetical protein
VAASTRPGLYSTLAVTVAVTPVASYIDIAVTHVLGLEPRPKSLESWYHVNSTPAAFHTARRISASLRSRFSAVVAWSTTLAVGFSHAKNMHKVMLLVGNLKGFSVKSSTNFCRISMGANGKEAISQHRNS